MTILEAIQTRVLLSDGAMGTQLQQAGLEPGGCGEVWNIEKPDVVLAIQRRYVDAGCDLLTTNTFGASRIMLKRHGHENDVAAINRAGVEVARRAFGDQPGFVVGDIGPFGGLMEPMGEVPVADVREAFREQARALVDAGVDAIIIETQTALEELELGLAAAKEAGCQCIIGSVAFDLTRNQKDARTMMGVNPEQAGEFLESHGAHIAALNCGANIDMAWAAKILERYRKVTKLPLMAQPNAGLPKLVKMQVVYDMPPEEMASGVPALIEAGARIVGGCCGSTPAHMAAFRKMIPRG